MVTKNHNQTVKSKKFTQVFSILTSCLLVFTSGTIYGWSSSNLPKLIEGKFVTQDEANIVLVLGSVGVIIGAPLSSQLADCWGRRNTLILATVPQMVCLVISAFFWSVYALSIARILGLYTAGMAYIIFPMFSGEVSEPSIRGRLSMCGMLALNLGILATNILGLYLDVRTATLVLMLIPITSLILLFLIFDSPYFYLMKKNDDMARESLKFYRGLDDVEQEFEELKTAIERQLAEEGTFKELFRSPANRKALFICLGLRFMQNMCGIMVLNINMETVVKNTGTHLSSSLSAFLLYLVQVISMFIFGCAVLDRYSKKVLLSISGVISGLSYCILAAYLIMRDYGLVAVDSLEWLPLTCLLVFMVFFSAGLGVIPYVLLAEMFSSSIKRHALMACTTAFSLATILSLQIYVYTAQSVGSYAPFLVFAGACFINVPFSLLLVPDTRGKTLEQIQTMIER